MFFKPKQNPAVPDMTDEQVKARLKQTTVVPERVEKYRSAVVTAVSCGGIILAVVVANALSLGSAGMIGLCFALTGALIGGKAYIEKKHDQWDRERELLGVEDNIREIRREEEAKSFAVRLKEKFIAAMTGGTEKPVVLSKPFKFVKPAARPNAPKS